jgi:antitoxin component of MazEF toxin-antitoxin module
MSNRLRVIYTGGAFVPVSPIENLNVPENAEVEITVHNPYLLPPEITDPEERARALRELVQEMQAHPITGDPPRLTREELHERR